MEVLGIVLLGWVALMVTAIAGMLMAGGNQQSHDEEVSDGDSETV